MACIVDYRNRPIPSDALKRDKIHFLDRIVITNNNCGIGTDIFQGWWKLTKLNCNYFKKARLNQGR
ncbi:MAG: hypothetical protein NT178_15240 [Proteobacteria bacterium]|nr:hypothetical protein [Pseudomonadota bacterium]